MKMVLDNTKALPRPGEGGRLSKLKLHASWAMAPVSWVPKRPFSGNQIAPVREEDSHVIKEWCVRDAFVGTKERLKQTL